MFVGKNVWVGSLVVIWVWMCCWIRSNIRNIILDNTHSKPDKHATKVSISDDKQEIVSEEEDSKCCERRSKRIFYHPEKWDYLSKTLTKYISSPQEHHILWMQIPAKFWWTTSSDKILFVFKVKNHKRLAFSDPDHPILMVVDQWGQVSRIVVIMMECCSRLILWSVSLTCQNMQRMSPTNISAPDSSSLCLSQPRIYDATHSQHQMQQLNNDQK